ncbi:uncharacterized protein LOC123519288 isoform X2 [Portunus trituberculatus]|uniref:uncharacterized protein LOC123519288 isoform X2 n=1 Tax=Portunus trituberculatus TaxID=210409 RepID=UPI001E1CE804|nr:uncharacterized protein LOC123519288 isoform X2 [Portunus trituberculatus]
MAVSGKTTSQTPSSTPSVFSFFRYMHKMKPSDLSPMNDDLSSPDSSLGLENEEPSPTTRTRNYCRKCDNCSSGTTHVHAQTPSGGDSPTVEEEQNNNNNNNNNNNLNNNVTAEDTMNANEKVTVNHEVEGGTQPTRSTSGEGKVDLGMKDGKDCTLVSPESGVDSPCDMDMTEEIKTPEVASKRSIAEVLSQVAKMERSSSSSASEPTRTPEAPDIVASTTKGRPKVAAAARRRGGDSHRSSDVATLAILCQHYAQLVQALKEENYLLSCAQSPLLATPKSGVRGLAGDTGGKTHLSGGPAGRGRSPKAVFTWDSDMTQEPGRGDEKDRARSLPYQHSRAKSDSAAGGSLSSQPRLKLHRSCSNSRDYINNNKTPRQSPTRAQDDEYIKSSGDFPLKERRHWALKPLRSSASKHRKEPKSHRKSSFSFFRDTENNENLNAESGSESPKMARTPAAAPLPSPTVGVLSTRISEMELKIEEILMLEPVDLMLRENSLDGSPARRSVGSGDTLRRSQRGNFYRHSVRDNRRDQHRQDTCDSEEACEEAWRRGCTAGVSAAGGGGGGSGGCVYQALSQAAHVEVDKLRQLVHLLNTRLTELSGRVLEVEARLREERQRTASMERCLERQGLETGCRGSRRGIDGNGRRHTPSFMAWTDATSENLLRNKVDMAREEIELLRQHIDLLLRMRQEDLKVYESTVDKFRHTIASGSQW